MSDTDLIKALGTRFIERRDVKAVQGEGIPWQPVKEKFALQDFRDHLDGTRTFGHYMVSPEGNCKLFALDLDVDKTGVYFPKDEVGEVGTPINPREALLDANHPANAELKRDLRIVAEAFVSIINRTLGIPIAVAWTGGKGLHVYGFTGSKPADIVRFLALGIMEEADWIATRGSNFFKHPHHDKGCYPNITVEVFPKQDKVAEDGFGNLMALPLGIHKGTGQRKHFCRFNVPHEQGWTEANPLDALSGDSLPWE